MKKIVVILGIFGYSYLCAEIFSHVTDRVSDYKIDTIKAQQNEVLAKKLQKFRSSTLSQEEISVYKEFNTSSLYTQDILILYTPQQSKEFNITHQDMMQQIEPKEEVFVEKAYKYVKKISKGMMNKIDTNGTKDGVQK